MTTSIPEFVADLVPIVALTLVVIGWIISNTQAKKRESRKETRRLVDDCQRAAQSAQTAATEYYTATSAADLKARQLEMRVKSQMKFASICLNNLYRYDATYRRVAANTFFDLYESLTGSVLGFESSSRAPLPDASVEVEKLFAVLLRFDGDLERAFVEASFKSS